jgi:hypothetical protein
MSASVRTSGKAAAAQPPKPLHTASHVVIALDAFRHEYASRLGVISEGIAEESGDGPSEASVAAAEGLANEE